MPPSRELDKVLALITRRSHARQPLASADDVELRVLASLYRDLEAGEHLEPLWQPLPTKAGEYEVARVSTRPEDDFNPKYSHRQVCLEFEGKLYDRHRGTLIEEERGSWYRYIRSASADAGWVPRDYKWPHETPKPEGFQEEVQMKSGVEIIADERTRQLTEEGWTPDRDVRLYGGGELAMAAACYALPEDRRESNSIGMPDHWPWDLSWWKPTAEDRIRELAKAGALIAAEIDRLQQKG